MFAYVGSRTTRERNARGEGISVFRVDPDSASLTPVQVLKGLPNPSFLALNRQGDRLYCVHGDTTTISSYRVSPGTGTLELLNEQDTQGLNPVHLALDSADSHIIVSNHIGASLCVLPVSDDGALQALCHLEQITGDPGPHRVEQKQAKPHHNPFSPDGRYLLVSDKGLDRIFSYQYQHGTLSLASTEVTREGSGPRHLVFHPSKTFVYCINELDSTVCGYQYEPESGKLAAQQILPSLPENYTGNSRAAELLVSPNGLYLYASNRGHDSIAIYSIDQQTGWLTFCGCTHSGGRTPRFITLTPDGQYLFALNEDDDCIVTFRIDQYTGLLHAIDAVTPCASPVCMIFSHMKY